MIPERRQFFSLPVAQVLIYHGNGFIGIQVAGKDEAHVVGYVVFVEIITYLYQRRVFQVLHGTDGGLSTIGVFFEKRSKHRFKNLIAPIVE